MAGHSPSEHSPSGRGWTVVVVYEADSGAAGDVEGVLSYLGISAPWAEATGRYAGPGRFFVALDAEGARLLDDYAGTLNDESGLAYEVVGPVSEGEGPAEADVGGAGGRAPALVCPACGAQEGFTAHESYVHKLALDGNGDAWDDNLGAGSDGERISTSCDSCGHEWREDARSEAESGTPAEVSPGVRGALSLTLGVLERAAQAAMDGDRGGGDAADYWADGGDGDRAIAAVRAEVLSLEGTSPEGGSSGQGLREDVRIFVGLDTFSQDHNDPLASVVVFPLRYPQVFSDDLDPDEPEKEVRDDVEMMRYAEGSYDFWSIRIFGADGSYRVLPEDEEAGGKGAT